MAAPKTARTHPPHTSKAPPPQAFITLQLLASSPLLMASLLQPMSLLSAIFPNIQSSPQPPTPTQFLSLLPNSLRTYSIPSSLCACGNLKLFTLYAQKWAMWLFVYIYFEAASWVETVIKLSVFTHCTILHPSPIWISFDFFFSPFLLVTKSLCMNTPHPQQTWPRSYTSTAQCTVTCEWLSLSWLGSPVKTWPITFLQSSDLWLLFITSAPQEELMFHFFDREDKVHVKGVINCNYTGKKLEKALLLNDKKSCQCTRL